MNTTGTPTPKAEVDSLLVNIHIEAHKYRLSRLQELGIDLSKITYDYCMNLLRGYGPIVDKGCISVMLFLIPKNTKKDLTWVETDQYMDLISDHFRSIGIPVVQGSRYNYEIPTRLPWWRFGNYNGWEAIRDMRAIIEENNQNLRHNILQNLITREKVLWSIQEHQNR